VQFSAGDYINFADASFPSLDQNFSALTMIYYFRARSSPSNDGLMGKSTIWYLAMTGATNLRFRAANVGDGQANAAVPSVADDQYHMAAGTFDGTSIRLYMDGHLRVTEDMSGVGDGTLGVNASNFNLGAYGGAGWTWNHDCSHAGLWKKALSDRQIKELWINPFCMFEKTNLPVWVGATSVGAPAGVTVPVMAYHYKQAGGM
jgi:hypothetical protein